MLHLSKSPTIGSPHALSIANNRNAINAKMNKSFEIQCDSEMRELLVLIWKSVFRKRVSTLYCTGAFVKKKQGREEG